jgi:dihydrofolate synthase / folylpolyglutamate synthase
MLNECQSIERKTMDLKLDRIQRVHALLGKPGEAFSTVHVGGTNGKGSVCFKVASGLQKKGFKVGLFSSPHLLCPTERIQVNQKPISMLRLEELFDHVEALDPNLSYFERMTLSAFLYFKEEGIDWGVIEVGLGGRLDATNIITPKICAITSIGYDHMELLGETLEKIAFEKGGIIKEGVPVILGPHTLFGNILLQSALEKKAPLHIIQEQGDYQKENECVAQEILFQLGFSKEPLPELPPCRYTKIEGPKPTILDVAHNLPGFKELFKNLERDFPYSKIGVIAGFSKKKVMQPLLDFIQEKCSRFFPLSFNNERSFYTQTPSFQESYTKACAECNLVVICGSFFIFSEVQKKGGEIFSDLSGKNEKERELALV